MHFCKLPQPVNSSGFDVTCHATCHNNDASASAHTSALRGRRFRTAVLDGWGGDKTPCRKEELLLITVEWRSAHVRACSAWLSDSVGLKAKAGSPGAATP